MVAIVDDDHSVRDGLVDLVRSMGFDAETFEGAERFLQSDAIDRTNCLITDMRMDGMSGVELCERLVKSGRRIPTILITAFPNEQDRERARRAGAIGYLTKPFVERELVDCITSALGGPGAKQ